MSPCTGLNGAPHFRTFFFVQRNYWGIRKVPQGSQSVTDESAQTP